MPHMVIFRDADGRPGYHQAEALDDAVRFVEELRNEREVSDTRVFAMQEVPIEFKTVWRVEIVTPGAEEVAPSPAAVVEQAVDDEAEREAELEGDLVPVPVGSAADEETADDAAPFTSVDAPAPAHARFGLFGR
jgi:hypothetical protein